MQSVRRVCPALPLPRTTTHNPPCHAPPSGAPLYPHPTHDDTAIPVPPLSPLAAISGARLSSSGGHPSGGKQGPKGPSASATASASPGASSLKNSPLRSAAVHSLSPLPAHSRSGGGVSGTGGVLYGATAAQPCPCLCCTRCLQSSGSHESCLLLRPRTPPTPLSGPPLSAEPTPMVHLMHKQLKHTRPSPTPHHGGPCPPRLENPPLQQRPVQGLQASSPPAAPADRRAVWLQGGRHREEEEEAPGPRRRTTGCV